MDAIEKRILETVADLHDIPEGAYNIRLNGKSDGRRSSANIEIVSKTDKPGIDIIIKPNTKGESVHIPVVVSQTGLTDLVYNDFYVGEGADVVIVAGCGIHNCGTELAGHDGIHTFHVERGAKVKYIEKHYGEGEGSGERIMNPTTVVELGEGAYMDMDTMQIKGIDSTVRVTRAKLGAHSTLVIHDKIMTHGRQDATADFSVDLCGDGSSANVVSRSVARDNSHQHFISKIIGNAACSGHTECDAIIMDGAHVDATPELSANNIDANLIHEAAIGKIAGEQLVKLMTLGLTEKEAEEQIINGFLK